MKQAPAGATQLIEYEPGIEIDFVFLQERHILVFKGHPAVMFLLRMDVLHDSSPVRFAHAKRSIPVLPCQALVMFIHPF
jgi:hypothetical protein